MRDEAREALEMAEGDWERALEILLDHTNRNEELKQRAVVKGCWESIKQQAAQIRTSYFREAKEEEPSGERDSRVTGSALRDLARRSWYDYQLPGGMRLGSATRDDLDAASHRYMKLAQTNEQRHNFVERVKSLLGDKEGTVEDHVSEEAIEEVAK